jgi:hypothetical protein
MKIASNPVQARMKVTFSTTDMDTAADPAHRETACNYGLGVRTWYRASLRLIEVAFDPRIDVDSRRRFPDRS